MQVTGGGRRQGSVGGAGDLVRDLMVVSNSMEAADKFDYTS